MPPAIACHRCQETIAPGGPRTELKLTMTAGFDGFIPEPEPGETPHSALKACEAEDSQTLEESVHLERHFTLCPTCRNVILKDPLQRPQEVAEDSPPMPELGA